jgi:trehalose synthase
MRKPAEGAGRRLIHINTSDRGGGVAEIIENVTRHDEAHDLRSGWIVIDAPDEFFAVTKGLHHLFHGRGDTTLLREGAHIYREVLHEVSVALELEIRQDDILVLHDPQTLGLAAWAARRGRPVYWHCHIGTLRKSVSIKEALWEFFANDLRAVEAVLVAEPGFLQGAPISRTLIVHPAIDPDAPKNVSMGSVDIEEHLQSIGAKLATDAVGPAGRIWQEGPLPAHVPVVLQVSRWDPLKGIRDVLRVIEDLDPRVHVVVAGPDPGEVLDDPEGVEQLEEALRQLRALPAQVRGRVHLIALSAQDRDLNALRVNALQRRADVVVQRSVEEGFGLTVTEAMFKAKPVVATRTGGIPRQIDDRFNGRLVEPNDDEAFIRAVNELVADARLRAEVGAAAEQSVREGYLIDRLVRNYDMLRK